MSLGAEVGAGAFSAVFQSQTPGADINVERSMYFGPNFEVSTAERASHALSTFWMFAEGSRGGELFDNFFLLFNPHPWTATVNVDFCAPNGGAPLQRPFTIPPGRRVTLAANDIPELAGQDFSTIVWSDGRHSRRTLDVLAAGWHAAGHAVGRRTRRRSARWD